MLQRVVSSMFDLFEKKKTQNTKNISVTTKTWYKDTVTEKKVF